MVTSLLELGHESQKHQAIGAKSQLGYIPLRPNKATGHPAMPRQHVLKCWNLPHRSSTNNTCINVMMTLT
jgi:hypothetical protein